MGKILKNIGFSLLIITTLFFLAIYISGFFGISKYIVISGSMEPDLYAGDVVFVNDNNSFENVKIGDVIVFKYSDMNVIHRVIEEKTIDGQKHLKTKGDANQRDDGYTTTKENYCGTALFHIDKFGYAVDFKNQIKE